MHRRSEHRDASPLTVVTVEVVGRGAPADRIAGKGTVAVILRCYIVNVVAIKSASSVGAPRCVAIDVIMVEVVDVPEGRRQTALRARAPWLEDCGATSSSLSRSKVHHWSRCITVGGATVEDSDVGV